MKSRIIVCILVLLAVVAGCEVGPNYKSPKPVMPAEFAAAYPQTQPSTQPSTVKTPNPRGVEIARWWQAMGDEELNALVDRAIAGSLDLEIAFTRLQEARMQEAVFNGVAFPSADAAAGAGRGSGNDSVRGRIPQPVYAGADTSHTKEITAIGGFDGGWEVDVFGRLRRAIEAAHSDTEAAAEARSLVLVTLISDVARAYLDVRTYQLRLAVADNEVRTEEQTVDLVQTRLDRGITNELDVALARRELATLKATVDPLRAALDASKRRLSLLLGLFPEELSRELDVSMPFPLPPPRIAAALPVDLLRRRPDIRQSERTLAAATARIGVATANLFPHLVLTAGVGIQSGRGPFRTESIWSAGPAAYWPLLDFGTLDSLVTLEDLRTREAALNYKKTILAAVAEVNDAISGYTAQQNHMVHLDDALVYSERAVRLASARYDRGLTDFLNVLDAQRQYYDLLDQYAQGQEAVTLQFIALYNGIGGGWEDFAPAGPPAAPRPAIVAAVSRLLQKDESAKVDFNAKSDAVAAPTRH